MKKKTAVVLCTLATLLLLIGSCATGGSTPAGGRSRGGVPSWYSDKDSAFPPDTYLAEVGEGDNLRSAKANAAGGIAQIFQNEVRVDSEIRTRYTEITGESGAMLGLLNQTDVNQTINQSSEQTLVNLRFSDPWTDDMGRVYITAFLDRQETGNLYAAQIQENDNRVVELLDRARTQEEPLRRYAFLDAAAVMAEANDALVQQLAIINPSMVRMRSVPYNLGDVKAARADQASALKIRVEVSGDSDGRIQGLLTDWASEKGFSITGVGDMFLGGVVSVETVVLNNDYDNLSWLLSISLLDTAGYPAVAMEYKGRSSGISPSAAESRAYLDMAEAVNRDYDREFMNYLAGFLEK